MAEKEACKKIVASVKAELQAEQQEKKSVKKDIAKETATEAANENSETESEYEEVEYVEEVTDDDSDEGAEVEDNDDDDEEAEIEEEEEEENDDVEEEVEENDDKNKVQETNKKQEQPKKISSKAVEVKTVSNQIEKEKPAEKTEVKSSVIETKKEVKESESQKNREVSAKEQSKLIILPLLQGLLQKNMQSSVSSSNNNSNSSRKSSSGTNLETERINKSNGTQPGTADVAMKKVDRSSLVVHHVEDSGTESGEDLKFIAAGLRDSLQIHSIENQSDNELITEVTNALNRLETSLREGNDLKLDTRKRNALLTLVARLQTGLISPEKITAPTPAPGQMADGDNELSSPESENRRYPRPGHQRFAKRRNRANRHTVGVSREELADARRYIEEMVMMESLSNRTTPDSGNVISPPEYPIQKQNSSGAVLGNGVQEPSTLFRPNQFVPSHLKGDSNESLHVQMRDKKQKFDTARKSLFEKPTEPVDDVVRRRYSDAYSPENHPAPYGHEQTPNSMVYEKNLYNRIHHSSQPTALGPVFVGMRPSAYQPLPSEAPITPTSPGEPNKSSRFMNKKMMMKRANTIDIPKPIKYMNDMESDSDAEERGINSMKSIGLRGTVQVTVKNKPRSVVPQFQPKTENDLKFLAFIQKQNSNNGLAWNNPSRDQSGSVANNWSNKFGNIKNAFESGAVATSSKPPMPTGQSSARNFWKKTTAEPIYQAKHVARQVSSSPKANDKIVRPPWAETHPPESPKITMPKPVPVNKFSHAPLSAFKPISPTSPRREPVEFQPIQYQQKSMLYYMNGSHSEPLHHYAEKPIKTIAYPNQPKTNHSPTLPWTANKGSSEHRVQNIAMTKFESKPQRHQSVRVQDQTYNDRVAGYNRLEQKRPSLPNAVEYDPGLQAPHMVQNMMHAAIVKEFPPIAYTSTNYTPEHAISTYVPDVRIERPDSLTNPEAEPLVLTSDRPFISPYDNQTESLATSPNVTQNDVSDSELDTDSITEYRAETKIMRGPVSQQAVTISNRTMRRGDEPNYVKNSKEANNLLSVMKTIKPTKPAVVKVTKEGRAYQAPKVESILPTNEAVNRFPQEIPSPQPTVQGYNPIYQQPAYKQAPLASIVPQSPTQPLKSYAIYPASMPDYSQVRDDTDEMHYEIVPRTNYVEPQRSVNQNISKTVYVGRPNLPEPYIANYAEPERSFQPYVPPRYEILPCQGPPMSSMAATPMSPTVATPMSPMAAAPKSVTVPTPMSPTFPTPASSRAATQQKSHSYPTPPAQKITKSREQTTKQQKITSHQIIKSGALPQQSEKRNESTIVSSSDVTSPTSPKDENPVMVFKKFGPPQPHCYRPNAYQYPLAEQPRKFSEPNIKASQRTTVNQSVTRSTTVSTKFVAPKIVETPSSPRPLAKNEVPSHVIYNNVRSVANYDPESSITSPRFPVNSLTKSDSWHQICQHATSNKPPSPQNTSSGGGFQLRRVKSGHTLDIPKMYEAGMNKAEISEKQKTVAAYFSGQKSPNSLSRNSSQTNIAEAATTLSSTATITVKKTSINRIRSSEKASISNQNPSTGLSRSQTMPHIHLLDESNVEDAFEELLKSS